jgi:hypothetical protein
MAIKRPGSTNVKTYWDIRYLASGLACTGGTVSDWICQTMRSGTGGDELGTHFHPVNGTSGTFAWKEGNAVECDGTNMPGLYRIDWLDWAYGTGASKVIASVSGANILSEKREYELMEDAPINSGKIFIDGAWRSLT